MFRVREAGRKGKGKDRKGTGKETLYKFSDKVFFEN